MSIEIIDNTKPKSAKFEYRKWLKTCPDLKTCSSYEKDKFYDREEERWHNGYGGLTNYHYFQLTQTKMKNAEGMEIRPYWRDTDEEKFFIPYHRANAEIKDLMIVKRREAGLSSVFWGVIPILNSIIFPGSTNLLTSADKDRIKEGFLNKTCVTYDSLDDEIRPENASARKEGYLYFAKQDPKTKKYSGLKSSIVCKDTVDKVTAFETYRAKSVFIDEIFLHPYAAKVRVSAQACVKKGFSKIAPIVLGGSCGVTSKEGSVLGEQLWHDADNLDIITVFIEGWKGISEADEFDERGIPTGKKLNFCINGHSDEKAATEWILRQRERLERATDKNPLNQFIKEYPLTIDEVFKSHNTNRWEEDVENIIKMQKKNVIQADVSCPKHTLVNINNNVTASLNRQGDTYILEHPKPNCIYILGVDGVGSDTDTGGEDGSNMAGTIVKMFDPNSDPYMPVAIHSERPKTIESGYRKLINLAMYYNKFGGFQKIWAEANAATASHFGAYLIQNNLKNWISMRKDLSGKGWTDQKKIFQYRTQEMIEFQYRQANIFIRRYAHSIQMIPLLDQMLLPKTANADILDSWLQFFTAKPDFGKPEKPKPPPRPKLRPTVKMVNGMTVTVWE